MSDDDMRKWIKQFDGLDNGDVFSADIEESEKGYEGTTITAIHVHTDVPNHLVYVELSDDDAREHGFPINEGRYGGHIYGPYSPDDESGNFTLELPPVNSDNGEKSTHRLSGFEYRPSIQATDIVEKWGPGDDGEPDDSDNDESRETRHALDF
jgi:hypothetical protein